MYDITNKLIKDSDSMRPTGMLTTITMFMNAFSSLPAHAFCWMEDKSTHGSTVGCLFLFDPVIQK